MPFNYWWSTTINVSYFYIYIKKCCLEVIKIRTHLQKTVLFLYLCTFDYLMDGVMIFALFLLMKIFYVMIVYVLLIHVVLIFS
eukprot:UN10474